MESCEEGCENKTQNAPDYVLIMAYSRLLHDKTMQCSEDEGMVVQKRPSSQIDVNVGQ